MAKIKTEKQYKAACMRIEELLKVVSNETPADDQNYLELDLIADLVADYEEEHFPVKAPAEHEPVICEKTGIVLNVYGMRAIGKKIKDVCFRIGEVEKILKEFE